MTILIVDDQVSVVASLISGIDWTSIQITKILKAYNAFQAKELIRSTPIDILLCDIEMPAEDGLQLYRWAIENHYDFECIFLTSHADFMYAKEALRLGSFDYILQPARYEDIQNTIRRAIEKLTERRENSLYTSYGQLIKGKDYLLFDDAIGKLLHSQDLTEEMVDRTIHVLEPALSFRSIFSFSLLQVLIGKITPDDLRQYAFRYGLTNIISEIAENYGQKSILIPFTADTFALLIYSPSGTSSLESDVYSSFFEQVIRLCSEYYKTHLAIYYGDRITFAQLPNTVSQLAALQKNNILRISRTFYLGDKESTSADKFMEIDYARLEPLSQHGDHSAVLHELSSFLDSVEEHQCFSLPILQNFQYHLLQLVFSLLNAESMTLPELLPDQAIRESVLSVDAFRSIPDARNVIRILRDAFERCEASRDENQNIAERVKQYVHQNIEKDLRRSDIAAALHISPDYLSHIFAKYTDISLMDYIIREKMQIARILIRTTSLPIGVIASRVGYSNFSHFSKTYKRIFGTSPTAEKKNSN